VPNSPAEHSLCTTRQPQPSCHHNTNTYATAPTCHCPRLLHPAPLLLQSHSRLQLQRPHRLYFSQQPEATCPASTRPAKAPLACKKQKLPADAPLCKDKIWLHTCTEQQPDETSRSQHCGPPACGALVTADNLAAEGHVHRAEQARDPARHLFREILPGIVVPGI
jgi:hypothetical protein